MSDERAKVRAKIREFRAMFRSFPALKPEEGYRRTHNIGARRKEEPQLFNKRGVYLIFNRKWELLYVGSTIAAFRERIFYYAPKRRYAVSGLAHVHLVSFEHDHAHFAPALELFLIRHFPRARNKIGKGLRDLIGHAGRRVR